MVEDEARAAIDTINRLIGGRYKLDIVSPSELEPVPKNARYMTHEQFQALRQNIERDGALASTPLCWKMPDGRLRVLSGNHRVKGAVAAGLPRVLVLYTDEQMARGEEVAVQLSHNSIVGQDDPKVLAELWAEVAKIEWKQYSGLDDKTMATLAAVSMPALAEAKLDMRTATFVFLPDEVERLDALLAEARIRAAAQHYYLCRLADHDRVLDGLAKVNATHNVINAAASLAVMLDIFEGHQEDLTTGWLGADGEPLHDREIPMAVLFGTDAVPSATAGKVKRALEVLVGRGLEAKAKWKALEQFADRVLSETT